MMNNRIVQAYRQAPWRTQLQWTGLFLLVLVFVASVTSIYLNVSASAAASGREIQRMGQQSEDLERSIADLRTQLAMLTSAANMEKRAEAMNFKPAQTDQTMYVTIPGYGGREPAIKAPLPGPNPVVAQPLIKSSYTESLSDWLFQGFFRPLEKQVQP
ncbi:MAG TPA: hypothetical protein VMT46_08190 [Anaerolineaceae bacterium]|nr:hypothetical protein [Anaerolineaceae bacterium]